MVDSLNVPPIDITELRNTLFRVRGILTSESKEMVGRIVDEITRVLGDEFPDVDWSKETWRKDYRRLSEQPDELPKVEEIKPCPYVNTPLSKNDGVSFILKTYEHYSDFVLFDDGKPARCFRFSAPKRE